MYAELTIKGIELKNVEIIPNKMEWLDHTKKWKLTRIITDKVNKIIYETWQKIEEDEEMPHYKDEDVVKLMISKIHGPYETKGSLKTAASKIRCKIRRGE